MATKPTSTADATWHHLLATRDSLLNTISISPDRQDEDRVAVIEDQLLDLAAPDLAAILFKLELLWAFRLEGQSAEARHRRRILDDLRHYVA